MSWYWPSSCVVDPSLPPCTLWPRQSDDPAQQHGSAALAAARTAAQWWRIQPGRRSDNIATCTAYSFNKQLPDLQYWCSFNDSQLNFFPGWSKPPHSSVVDCTIHVHVRTTSRTFPVDLIPRMRQKKTRIQAASRLSTTRHCRAPSESMPALRSNRCVLNRRQYSRHIIAISV